MKVWLASLLLLGGCSGQVAASDGTPPREELVVFAAASLTEAFADIATGFELANPDTKIIFNSAGSQQLAGQIIAGAPADVFASADTRQMDNVAEQGLLAAAPVPFAQNELAIAVERGNPLDINGLEDLARPDLAVVLAADEVPAGRYTNEMLAAKGIPVAPVSREPSVRAALSRVVLGEADAGVVYRSDISANSGDVTGVAIPAEDNIIATYPAAVIAGGNHSEAGQLFVAYLVGTNGQATLLDHGFGVLPSEGS